MASDVRVADMQRLTEGGRSDRQHGQSLKQSYRVTFTKFTVRLIKGRSSLFDKYQCS